MDASDVEKLAKWTAPKEVQTKYGPRILRKSIVTPEFSAAWREHKEEIKKLGANFGKDQNGNWELAWWAPLSTEVQQARAESVEASRAVSAEVDVPCPTGLAYMPFQKAGIRFGLLHDNVLIADEMGLGKTIQTIGIINADERIKTVLVVCPKSLKINWRNELRKWLTRPLTVACADGMWPSTDIVILNYEALGKWDEMIARRTWGALVVDEAHLIKNKDTLRSKYIKGYTPKPGSKDKPVEGIKAVRKIRLTGTPIVNKPSELYNLINDLAPEQFGNFWSFAKRYRGVANNGFGWEFSGATNLDELQRRLRETIMIRRLKSEVLTELPRKIRQIIEIEAETPEQRACVRRETEYGDEVDDRLVELRAAVELSKAEGEEAYRAAVQAMRDAMQVDFTEMARLRHDTAVSKVDSVVAHVKACLEDNDAKIVVAAHHIDVVRAIESALAEFNPVILIGGLKEQERQASVDTFQNDPRCRVFVAGITAAGVGITLTAASQMVFAELDWVPGNVTQMEDRIHRIGQVNTVLIQHIVLSDSLDARMAKTLVEKQEVIDKALDVWHPDRVRPVYTPKKAAATQEVKLSEIEKIALTLTPEMIAEIHGKLRWLAGDDMDRAAELNGVGFNKVDSLIGHRYAEAVQLTPKMAAVGMKLCTKYHRQVGQLSWKQEALK